MFIRICDKCKEEIREPNEVFGRELCEDCLERLKSLVNEWVDDDSDDFAMEEELVPDGFKGFEWHSQQLGFPPVRGNYLITVEFVNKSEVEGESNTISHMVRIAKYTGAPCWYKLGKEYGLIEETGGKVTAWAELPEAYERGSF